MYAIYGLTLVVNHACNLRCAYCYTGDKLRRPMPTAVGRKSIDRALNSITPGCTLELGFFGGEPLLEAELIRDLVAHARLQAATRRISLSLSMTTNGTIDTRAAWEVMLLDDLHLAISHDGLPEVHDRHRQSIDRQPSSQRVERTLARLLDCGREFRVVLVVRPDTVAYLAAGLEHLYQLGVRHFDPSLDLWATWNCSDGERLETAVNEAADFWAEHLPDCSVSWFDEKAATLARVPTSATARCGFGHGEIAVTPAGNLYPCERLVADDAADNPMRLPGDALIGDDFLSMPVSAGKYSAECTSCTLLATCSTSCRCSNYIRTGDVRRPDRLLCLWDQACHRATLRALASRGLVRVAASIT